MGLEDYASATFHIWQLPYHRTQNPQDLSLILKEGQGTSSGKHALLALLAHEHGHYEISLQIILYRIHSRNTPQLRDVLAQHYIEALPEAHCCILYNDHYYDFTFPNKHMIIDPEDIIEIHSAFPTQIPLLKHRLHWALILSWSKKYHYNPNILWQIRETCIQRLS
jgi:hypothetical protein